MTSLRKESIYTRAFVFLCISNFLFSASFQMLIPELPNFLTRLGGAPYKGFILAAFTLTAGVSRPFSGKLTDTVGRVPVMVFGSLVCVVCACFYPLVTSVTGFFVLRTLHGFSTGFKPTATAAYVADITEVTRRGEAMSGLGLSSSLGFSMGPAVGGYITNIFGLNGLFALSALCALLSVTILSSQLKETLVDKQKFTFAALKISVKDIFDFKALNPFFIQFFMAFTLGTILTIIPDRSTMINVTNKGLFFTVYTLASLGVRLLAGRSSDKFGRLPILKITSLGVATALILLAQSETLTWFLISATLFGFFGGMNTPTLQAWTVDCVSPQNRGRGLATMFIALEAGIGLGAISSQAVYNNVPSQITYPFYVCAGLLIVSFIYLNFLKEPVVVH